MPRKSRGWARPCHSGAESRQYRRYRAGGLSLRVGPKGRQGDSDGGVVAVAAAVTDRDAGERDRDVLAGQLMPRAHWQTRTDRPTGLARPLGPTGSALHTRNF